MLPLMTGWQQAMVQREDNGSLFHVRDAPAASAQATIQNVNFITARHFVTL